MRDDGQRSVSRPKRDQEMSRSGRGYRTSSTEKKPHVALIRPRYRNVPAFILVWKENTPTTGVLDSFLALLGRSATVESVTSAGSTNTTYKAAAETTISVYLLPQSGVPYRGPPCNIHGRVPCAILRPRILRSGQRRSTRRTTSAGT